MEIDKRAAELAVGDTFTEDGMGSVTVADLAWHGDTVLVFGTDGLEVAIDRDTVVQLVVPDTAGADDDHNFEPDDTPPERGGPLCRWGAPHVTCGDAADSQNHRNDPSVLTTPLDEILEENNRVGQLWRALEVSIESDEYSFASDDAISMLANVGYTCDEAGDEIQTLVMAGYIAGMRAEREYWRSNISALLI